ncbi:MAG TPA: alpha/beta hydrolase, partial [Novosphingobium sp.]|nr:alpha/beta hydrolase [Novosphingobium sp.]
MRRLAALLCAVLALVASPLAAQQIVEETVVWVDEQGNEVSPPEDAGANWRFVAAEPAPVGTGIARFGPFRVIDGARAAMVDVSDTGAPAAFAAMLRAHPGIRLLDMVEVPGTLDDRANLRLGRMIRAAG